MPDTTANYLLDLGTLLKEAARKAKTEARAAAGTDGHGFALGRASAYHEVISLMQQQAAAFQLPLRVLSLADIDPDRDLL